jgi:AcrR family transcriptional regulator
MTRTGRRPGAPDTREAILRIARQLFADRGYEATSLRHIAGHAGVDPALLIHYFKTKEGLFIAAMGLPSPLSAFPEDLGSLPLSEAVEVLVRRYLQAVDSEDSRNAILALVRSAVSNEGAARLLRECHAAGLLRIIRELSGEDDAELRASLVAAQLVGIAMLRHVVRLEPLTSATPDEIVKTVAPAIESCLRRAP